MTPVSNEPGSINGGVRGERQAYVPSEALRKLDIIKNEFSDVRNYYLIRDALISSQSPEPSSSEVRVPKGWKLVPEEPTDGMWDAFFRARDFDFQAQMREAKSLGKGWKGLPAVVWDAMLAAAPTLSPTLSQPIEAQPIHALPMPKYDFQGNEPTPSQPVTGEEVEVPYGLIKEAVKQYVRPLRRRMANQRKALAGLEKQNAAHKALFYQHAARADAAEARLSAVEGALRFEDPKAVFKSGVSVKSLLTTIIGGDDER